MIWLEAENLLKDEEYLFKDTDIKGIKYLRLKRILPKIKNDQRIGLLSSIYNSNDEISGKRLNELIEYLDSTAKEEKKNRSNKNGSGNGIRNFRILAM